ncbi:MAG: hypothetical protein Q4D24_05410 [Erysipelotrichaceae bacterium]|nr:hypothetical protein [Erysipelotrichaceae bacterium]
MKKTTELLLISVLLTGCAAPAAETGESAEPVKTQEASENPTAEPAETPVPEATPDPEFLQEAIGQLERTLDPFYNDGDELPQIEDAEIVWSIVSGNAVIEDNVIRKTENSAEYEPIVLSASADGFQLDHSFGNILLLDPYVGYVISYFSERTSEPETMKLAYTYNGVQWFALNGDRAVLRATVGTGRLRDPAIFRKKDGTFAICATQGYETDAIYLYDSQDLTSFTDQRLLKVNRPPLSEEQAWAPESFYDHTLDQYVIYWSSVVDEGMFYNLSGDLQYATEPQRLLNPGYVIIDGTMIKCGADYAIVFKDERYPMEDYSTLISGYSEDGWTDFKEFSQPISQNQSEGPMIMPDLENEGYYVFYDDYTRFRFHALYTPNFRTRYYETVPEEIMTIPLDSPAHSHAIPVTQKEMDRVVNYWH